MFPIRNQVMPRTGRRGGGDHGRRMPRRSYALAGLCLTFALSCGVTGAANAAVAASAPPAPTGLAATAAGSSEVDLTWTAPTAPSGLTLAGYDVYQGTSPGGESAVPVNSVLVTASSYAIPGLDSGATAYFVVTAVYQNSKGGDIPSFASNETVMPAAPAGLAATAAGSSEVNLTWTAPTAPSGLTLAGYDVYQGTSPGGESAVPVNNTLTTATSYTVPGLNSQTTYHFDVTAVYQNSEGDSIPGFPSGEASATTSPAGSRLPRPAPADLAATAAGSSAVNLTWAVPTVSHGASLVGYDVNQGTSSGGESPVPVNSVLVTATSYTIRGLASGTTYYFDVTAVYRTGQSPPSREASATTANLTGAPEPQAVHFGPLASHPVGTGFTVSATASSGLPVSFSSDTPRICAVSGSAVRTLAAGRCEIRAAQGGNADFQPAADVIQGFTVSPAGGFTTGTPTGRGTGPGKLIVILLAVAILLAAGILALAAAGMRVIRRRPRSLPPTAQAAAIQAKPQPGPPAAIHIRVTGTDATHAVRIEPCPGTRSTTIEEVQS